MSVTQRHRHECSSAATVTELSKFNSNKRRPWRQSRSENKVEWRKRETRDSGQASSVVRLHAMCRASATNAWLPRCWQALRRTKSMRWRRSATRRLGLHHAACSGLSQRPHPAQFHTHTRTHRLHRKSQMPSIFYQSLTEWLYVLSTRKCPCHTDDLSPFVIRPRTRLADFLGFLAPIDFLLGLFSGAMNKTKLSRPRRCCRQR